MRDIPPLDRRRIVDLQIAGEFVAGEIDMVPAKDANEPARDPSRLDQTAEYLQACGLPAID